MFRRRRSASLSRPGTAPSASAQTAATQAFRASQSSHANLSNAAAAAALRSTTSTPIPVSEVQTRRMLQRQSSNSSHGSAPGLQRKNSSGSMTERTFRSPSPNRPNSRSGPSHEPQRAVPPVPPVPQHFGNGTQNHRRAASLEPQPPRVTSPPPRVQGGRGVSLDRGNVPTPKRPKSSASNLGDINELERADSRNSINFSYPMNARPNSPPPRSQPPSAAHAASLYATRSSITQMKTASNGLPPAEVSNVQQNVSNAANAPVKKKKKKVAAGAAEGSHLASGGTGGKPMGTAVPVSGVQESSTRPEPPIVAVPPAPTEPASKPKKKKKATVVTANIPSPQTQASPESDSDSSEIVAREKRSQRASGTLNKQPSIVREDWEGEQAAKSTLSESPPVSSPIHAVQGRKEAYAPNTTRQLSEAKTVAQLPPTLITTMPSPNLEENLSSPNMLHPNDDLKAPPRPSSTSPSPNRSRSARFSAQLASELSAERRHEPPPRSISPAKSAMKHHSPSPQPRSPVDVMPGGWRLSSQTPSETSDTNSLASTDGVGPGPRRRKSARVSFDAEPEVVGTAVPVEQKTDSPGTSPASKERKSWLGLVKAKPPSLNTIPSEDDMEEVMKPRPALPSFGSIRGKRDVTSNQPLTLREAGSPPSSASSSLSNMATMDTSISSDHAIGALLAQDLQKTSSSNVPPTSHIPETSKEVSIPHLHSVEATPVSRPDPNLPLPPEVTSVEGSGYISDTDGSIYSNEGDPTTEMTTSDGLALGAIGAGAASENKSQMPATKQAEKLDAGTLEVPSHLAATEPPEITVHPATPGTDSKDDWLVNVPGGFPVAADPDDRRDHVGNVTAREIATSTPADLGIAEARPDETTIPQHSVSPPVGGLAEALRLQPKDDDENDSEGGSSIYSDAAEDIADLDGDGFGSINAIVESPMLSSPTRRIMSPPDSPPQSKSEIEIETDKDWNEAQARWSSIAQHQRESINKATKAENMPTMEPPPKPKSRKTKKKVPVSSAIPEARPTALLPSTTKSLKSSSETAPMRKSMRVQPAASQSSVAAVSSSRTGQMKSSMRQPQNVPVVSAAAPTSQPKGALQKKSIPTATIPVSKPALSKPIERTMSEDSDSSSSFRKRRRTKSMDGRYSMRRSMRGTADERPQSPQAPAGQGIQSLSLPTDRKPFSSAGASTMRRTMRTSTDSGAPTLRGHQQTSSNISGVSKTSTQSKPTIRAPAPSPTVASRFKSRFANDSDDEEAPGIRSFRSRFDDSSDEETGKLRPVRGIPQKAEDGDSTDLEDSSDEGTSRRSKVQINSPKALEAQASNYGHIQRPSSGSGRDLSKSNDMLASPSFPKKKGLFGRFRSKKVQNDNLKVAKSKAESPARRDTHLERTRAELERTRSPVAETTSPSHGKLQRRVPSRIMSDSWLLPPKLGVDEDRPSTSDGVGSPVPIERPLMGLRQDTSSTMRTEGGSPVLGRSGKKKKFPMLRKAFGLTD